MVALPMRFAPGAVGELAVARSQMTPSVRPIAGVPGSGSGSGGGGGEPHSGPIEKPPAGDLPRRAAVAEP